MNICVVSYNARGLRVGDSETDQSRSSTIYNQTLNDASYRFLITMIPCLWWTFPCFMVMHEKQNRVFLAVTETSVMKNTFNKCFK